jgi:hypothetical protein
MFDEAALALEEINPVDKTRNEVPGRPRQHLHGGREMGHGRSGANHLVKVEPENSGWWINLAYAPRRCEVIKSAEAILLRAREKVHC